MTTSVFEFDIFKFQTGYTTSGSTYIPVSYLTYLSIKDKIMGFGISAFSGLFLSFFGARLWA